MKKVIAIFIMFFMMVCCGTAMAQNPNKVDKRISREQLAEKQATYISNQLALDDVTGKRFITTYCNCQKEIWALGPRMGKRNPNATEQETEEQIKKHFEFSQKILNIRQKYYAEYSKFLTQKQIQQVYQLEKQMMQKFAKKHQGKKPMGQGRYPQKVVSE
jgi:hypothetical protein